MYNTEFGRRLRSRSTGGSPSSTPPQSRRSGAGAAGLDRLMGGETSGRTSPPIATEPGSRRVRDSPSRATVGSTSLSGQAVSSPSRSAVGRSSTSEITDTARGASRSTPDRRRLGGRQRDPIVGDRFIPSRDGSDVQAQFQLMEDDSTSPGRPRRKTKGIMDAQKEEANVAYNALVQSELGLDNGLGSSSGRAYNAGTPASSTSTHVTSSPSHARRSSTSGSGVSAPTTPNKKNLFSYQSPTRSKGTPSRGISDKTVTRELGTRTTPSGQGLFSGSPSGATFLESLDSPTHQAYSTSPIKLESQRILQSPRRPPRVLSRMPYKVLDAPDLADDFYLNLVDWSAKDVLSVGLKSCVYLWSAKTAEVTKLLDLQSTEDKVTGLSWSGRGNHLAVGTHDGLVQIWDAQERKLIRTMRGHNQRVGTLAWNEHILSTGSRDRTIFHRDVRAPEHHVRQLLGHRQEVCGLKWNTETNQLASGGNDNKLMVWDGLLDQPLHRFSGHTAAIKAIAWSPHQHGVLASGGGTQDMKIRFWNTVNGTMLSETDTSSQVCNLMWSKSSNELISTHGYSTGKVQNQIQVWRYPSMQHIATLTGHTMRVLYLAMSPDGSSIVTGAGDETLRFWALNIPQRPKDSGVQSAANAALNPFVKLR